MSHRTRTWAHFALILVVLLCTSVVFAQDATPEPVGIRPDAPTYALHGPYWVGTIQLAAKTVLHTTVVTIWYPASNASGAEESMSYNWRGIRILGHAIQDAAPGGNAGPYPLVIFSHGANGVPLESPYLTENLASYGFVVMAIDYTDNMLAPAANDDYTFLFTRPQDVSWQIDYAEKLNAAGGRLASMIDTKRVAVVGHSLGAQTALLAAGAQLDWGPASWCGQNPEVLSSPESGSVNYCSSAYPVTQNALARTAGLNTVPEDLWPSWADPRVDAIVPLAPGLFVFGPQSFTEVRVPTLVMVGSTDHWIHADSPLYMPYAYEYLKSDMKSLVIFENGDHMIFSEDCDAAPWLIDMGAYFFCSDPVWDMNRAHDLINHFTTAFLLDVLKGDKEAHKALLPDAVSFPGIQYKAQGY